MLTVLLATLGLTQTGWPHFFRAILLLLAVAGVVFVSWEIVKDKPGVLAAMYLLFYLVLLYPLCIGLSLGVCCVRPMASNSSETDGQDTVI